MQIWEVKRHFDLILVKNTNYKIWTKNSEFFVHFFSQIFYIIVYKCLFDRNYLCKYIKILIKIKYKNFPPSFVFMIFGCANGNNTMCKLNNRFRENLIEHFCARECWEIRHRLHFNRNNKTHRTVRFPRATSIRSRESSLETLRSGAGRVGPFR